MSHTDKMKTLQSRIGGKLTQTNVRKNGSVQVETVLQLDNPTDTTSLQLDEDVLATLRIRVVDEYIQFVRYRDESTPEAHDFTDTELQEFRDVLPEDFDLSITPVENGLLIEQAELRLKLHRFLHRAGLSIKQVDTRNNRLLCRRNSKSIYTLKRCIATRRFGEEVNNTSPMNCFSCGNPEMYWVSNTSDCFCYNCESFFESDEFENLIEPEFQDIDLLEFKDNIRSYIDQSELSQVPLTEVAELIYRSSDGIFLKRDYTNEFEIAYLHKATPIHCTPTEIPHDNNSPTHGYCIHCGDYTNDCLITSMTIERSKLPLSTSVLCDQCLTTIQDKLVNLIEGNESKFAVHSI